MRNWKRFYGTFQPNPDKQVDYVDLEVCFDDAVAYDSENDEYVPVYITDLLFQPGNKVTGWVPETREMMKQLTYDNDETSTQVTANDVYNGPQPTTYTDLKTRWFNIVGRGHSVITIPNQYPENWNKEILTTGLDLTLYPKEDFDVLRVSTNVGILLPKDRRKYQSFIEDYPNDSFIQSYFPTHPLHYRYTREFWINGASAGTEIKILASQRKATVGGTEVQIAGQEYFDIDGYKFYIGRKQFLLAPNGANRYRIEFYKHTTYETSDNKVWQYLDDTGIGFYGIGELVQWTYGRSRV